MNDELTLKNKEIQALRQHVHELEQKLAEAQARTNQENLNSYEERFRRAILAAPLPLMIRRDDGRILTINTAWTDVTGYTLEDIPTIEEWTRKAYGELGPQRQTFILDEGFSQTGIKKWGEFEVTTRSGEKRLLDFSTAPLGLDEKGRELVMTMGVDITERKQAEQELRLARDQAVWLARFPGENPNPVARVSAEGLVLYCNSPAAGLPGWKFKPDQPLPHPFQPLLETVMSQGQVFDHEIQLDEQFYAISMVPIQNEGYANLYGRNITASKEAEKSAVESKRRIDDILTSLGDGLFALNRGWQIIYINQQAAQIAGLPKHELIGKNLWELWPELLGTALESYYRRAMDEGISEQFRIRGSRSERSYDVNVYPSSEGITIFYTDKTEQILAEERFNQAFHSSPNAVVISRIEDGRIELINKTFVEFFGYSEEETIGKTSTELNMFANQTDRQTAVQILQRDKKVRDFELDVRLKSGEIRNVILSIEIITVGGAKTMLTTIQDITLRKQAQEELKDYAERLERSNRELEQFAFMASHDLQEPLRKIEMFGDLLMHRSTSLNDIDRDYLSRMWNAAERMREMVRGLLELSRINTQGEPFALVDLSEIAQEVRGDMENLLRETSGKVEIGALPSIEGDAVQLRQLFQNLIGNALKYHRPDIPPEVKVAANTMDRKVQISVEDNGIGFNEEDADRIFQPFQRLVGRSEYEGSGIGLAICRRIVERHEGTIYAVSQQGQGTTFVVTLPIHHSTPEERIS